ncbi:Adaptin family protein, partial [Prunus dulcis]
ILTLVGKADTIGKADDATIRRCHVAVKNNQQPVWYFNDKISLHVFFTEDGRMKRANFLETWRSLPDSNEITRDFPGIVVSNVEATLDRLPASNTFFIAKRKHANQDVFYFSVKIPRGIPF